MGIGNSITSLSLSLSAALLDMWAASLSLGSRPFRQMQRNVGNETRYFPRQKNAIASPIAQGIAQFVMNIFRFRRMFSNLRFFQDHQDAVLTLVTCDNLCPRGAAVAVAAASSTAYNATLQDEGKYRARRGALRIGPVFDSSSPDWSDCTNQFS